MQISFTKRKVHVLYLGLAVVSMLLAGVSYVRAQELSDPMPPPEGRSEAMREAATERLAGLREDQQNRFINLVRNVFTRMEAAVTRLENIGDRIETRIETLDSEGYDVAPARKPLADARAKLAEARERLQDAKADAEDGLVSDTPRERFAAARTEFLAVRDLIREAFILLREALAELRDAAIEQALNGQPATATVVRSADVTRSVTE
jgi:hypothetical protein